MDSAFHLRDAFSANLLEEELEYLDFGKKSLVVKVAPKKIFTVRLSIYRQVNEVNDACELIYENSHLKENFEDYPYASYVSEEEIQSELARAEALRKKADHPMWRRTALEAQLSAILARHRSNEERITELGYGLNEARVQRRVYDYINQFKSPDEKE